MFSDYLLSYKQSHIDRNADITVSCAAVGDRYFMFSHLLNVFRFYIDLFVLIKIHCFISTCLLFSRASDYGLVKVDSRGRIIQFSEKPKGADLKSMVSPVHLLKFK
jgi:glucose-1-phosphate adenylyltransferase